MRSSNRRVWGDRLASAGVFVLVLFVILSLDARVREQLEARVTTTATVRGTTERLHEAGSVLWDAARTQSIEHAPMTALVVAAGRASVVHDAGIGMPFILALEPNRVQAGRLSAVVRGLHADLTLVTSIDRALQALTDSLPDLILIPALLSRKDETALTNRLRELGAAASHVQTLTIPILAGTHGSAVSRRSEGTPSGEAAHSRHRWM